MLAHQFQQLLVALLQLLGVIVVGGEVVGTQIDAYYIRLITAEVPFLVKEAVFIAQLQIVGIASIFILNGHAGTG